MSGASLRFLAPLFALAAGCFPSFDGLTGGGAGVAPVKDAAVTMQDAVSMESAVTMDGAVTMDAAGETGPICVVDTDAASSKNCGQCGRDCELGQCVGGDCTPYPFVSDQQPVELAIDHAYVYFTNGTDPGSIYRIARSGAGGAQLIVSGQKNPFGIAVTADRIYWVNQGTADQNGRILGSDGAVMSSALDGTDLQLVAPSFKHPLFLVIDGGRVYVSDHGVNDPSTAADGDITSCSIPVCADRRLHGGIALFPVQVQVRAGTLYWTTDPSSSDGQAGSIWQMPLTGAAASPLFPGKPQAYRMTFTSDGSTLYYTSKNLQSVTRHPLGPGDVTQLHDNFEPHAVVVDDTELFVLVANDYTVPQGNVGSLLRMGRDDLNKDGSAPPSLRRYIIPRGGDAIVDGGRSVYFTTATGIIKLVK
jgi:hypothetical protein